MTEPSALVARIATRHLPQPEGRWAMVEDGERTRFAMALFDDVPRLKTAAIDLVALGLAPANLCLAGERAAVENGNAQAWAGPEHVARLVPLGRGTIVLSVIGETAMWHVNTPIARTLEARAQASATTAMTTGWDFIIDHLDNGALLLIALVPTAPVQNEAMRILLRYSRHPVHADEFFRIN
jgi:hypothetical protein